MKIRPFMIKDIDKIMDIENSCFINGRYNKEQILYENKNELSKFYVCENNGEIVGFIIFMITFNSATIVQIATHPKSQHKGVATMLLEQMILDIKSLGYGKVETITLEVRTNNIAAHNFYLKNGFKDVLIKNKYYTNGDDAFYMSRIML